MNGMDGCQGKGFWSSIPVVKGVSTLNEYSYSYEHTLGQQTDALLTGS